MCHAALRTHALAVTGRKSSTADREATEISELRLAIMMKARALRETPASPRRPTRPAHQLSVTMRSLIGPFALQRGDAYRQAATSAAAAVVTSGRAGSLIRNQATYRAGRKIRVSTVATVRPPMIANAIGPQNTVGAIG